MSTLAPSLNAWYVLAAVIAAVFTALGVMGTQWYNHRTAKDAEDVADRHRAREDDALSDRINRLVQEEADKRIAVIKTDFELKIIRAEVRHQDQLTSMRLEFETKLKEQARKIGALASSLEIRGCDVVDCPNRVKVDGFIKVGGTDSD
jgi:hypothetical protein